MSLLPKNAAAELTVKNARLIFEPKSPPVSIVPPLKASSPSPQPSQTRYTEKLKEVEAHLKEEQSKNLILKREKQLLQTEVENLKSLLTANSIPVPASPTMTISLSSSSSLGPSDCYAEEQHRRRASETEDKTLLLKLLESKRSTELGNEITSLKKELSQAEDKINEVNKQLYQAIEEKNLLLSLMNEKMTKLDKTKKKMDELELQVEEHKKSLQNEGSRTASAVAEREELHSTITNLKNSVENLENENKLLREQESVLLERIKAETSKRIDLEKNRESDQQKIFQQHQIIQDLESKNESPQTASNPEALIQPRNLEQILDQNNSSSSALKEEIKVLKEELEAKSKLEQEVIMATQNFMQAVQKQKEAHESERQELYKKLTEQKQEYTDLKSRYKALMRQHSAAENSAPVESTTTERELRRKHSSRSGSESSSLCSSEVNYNSRSSSPCVEAAAATISGLVNELIVSEDTFIRQLYILRIEFLKPMVSFPDDTCPITECHNVHNSVDVLITANSHFKELMTCVAQKTLPLNSAFTFLCDSFKAYRTYYTSYDSAVIHLKNGYRTNKNFRRSLSELEAKAAPNLPSPVTSPTKTGKIFFGLLRLPLSRISEYLSFMEKIFHVDIQKPEPLVQAHNSLKSFVTEVSSKVVEIKHKLKVGKIEQKLVSYQDPILPSAKLSQPQRSWVYDGSLKVKTNTEKKPRDRWVFLFSDLLLETKVLKKSNPDDSKYECKHCVMLSTLDLKDTTNTNEFTLTTSGKGSSTSITFAFLCNTTSDKEVWLNSLNGALALVQSKRSL
ncbi:hypothetical protein Pelo_1824 [Pelomyxa schiedti]|nr:hypothetical protein Pelo_1824 [Pelomyxa schiedti]